MNLVLLVAALCSCALVAGSYSHWLGARFQVGDSTALVRAHGAWVDFLVFEPSDARYPNFSLHTVEIRSREPWTSHLPIPLRSDGRGFEYSLVWLTLSFWAVLGITTGIFLGRRSPKMRRPLSTLWRLLGGGFRGTGETLVRCVNVALIGWSGVVAYVAVTSFAYRYDASWDSGVNAVSHVSISAGWAEYGVYEWYEAPLGTCLGTAEPQQGVGWHRLLADHADWPFRLPSEDEFETTAYSYSLIHAVFHLWSLPLLCGIRAAFRKRWSEHGWM